MPSILSLHPLDALAMTAMLMPKTEKARLELVLVQRAKLDALAPKIGRSKRRHIASPSFLAIGPLSID